MRTETDLAGAAGGLAADAEPAAQPPPPQSPPAQPHGSAMLERFGWIGEWLGRRLFGGVVMHESAIEKIRQLSERGTVVYVLRHGSFLDYFLVNHVLRREGLPLATFANGVSMSWVAPWSVLLRRLRAALMGRVRRTAAQSVADHDWCAEAVGAGRPVLVFMRAPKRRSAIARLWRGNNSPRVGADYLREILHVQQEAGTETFVVPLALFRGHSFRRAETPGISALVYTASDEPSDTRKFVTYWWNRNDLFITVGTEVAMTSFRDRYSADSEDRLVRRLTRAIQIFLYREERIVLGPAIMPRRKIKSLVLDNEETRLTIQRIADEKGVPEAKVRKQAEGYFEEMAASFNGVLFAIFAFFFKKLWKRMIQGLEPVGLERVIEKAKHHPIVLVPCHRSHFDYLTITYLFHMNFVSPPHIAAGANMNFWPFGSLFRAAGAFFIRRHFGDDELYKTVFRQYLKFLIGEGYTQEFFIEGGRSRTGKMLAPKLGMLSAEVNAFLTGVRGDLYFVPVSIHYGRIVEEDAYSSELSGGEKESESFGALLRARRFLQQKYGTIHVSFAEPISLNEELGDRKQRFIEKAGDEDVEEERRRFVQKLGFRILKDVNDASVAGASSISATVLLGASHFGYRYEDYREQANALADLVRLQGLLQTGSLGRNYGDFRESMEFLQSNGLIEVLRRGDREVLVVKDNRRLALDFYKNNLIHAFLTPSLVAYCMLDGVAEEDLPDAVWWWLDLLRWEFALPERDEMPAVIDGDIAHFRELGAISDEGIDAEHPAVKATVNILENFRESYYVTARTIADALGEDGMTEKALVAETRREHKTSMLLGEVVKAEGASEVVFVNAIKRLREFGFVEFERRGRGGRESWVLRGPRFGELRAFVDVLAGTVGRHVYNPRQAPDARLAVTRSPLWRAAASEEAARRDG